MKTLGFRSTQDLLRCSEYFQRISPFAVFTPTVSGLLFPHPRPSFRLQSLSEARRRDGRKSVTFHRFPVSRLCSSAAVKDEALFWLSGFIPSDLSVFLPKASSSRLSSSCGRRGAFPLIRTGATRICEGKFSSAGHFFIKSTNGPTSEWEKVLEQETKGTEPRDRSGGRRRKLNEKQEVFSSPFSSAASLRFRFV